MADTTRITWDKRALGHVIGTAPETRDAITQATRRIEAGASSMSAGYTSSEYRDRKTGEKRGPTPAKYSSDVKQHSHAWVGIVYTANYAAQKDNMENNTLMKAVGNG